jgi:hypothetical protein
MAKTHIPKENDVIQDLYYFLLDYHLKKQDLLPEARRIELLDWLWVNHKGMHHKRHKGVPDSGVPLHRREPPKPHEMRRIRVGPVTVVTFPLERKDPYSLLYYYHVYSTGPSSSPEIAKALLRKQFGMGKGALNTALRRARKLYSDADMQKWVQEMRAKDFADDAARKKSFSKLKAITPTLSLKTRY